MPAPSMQSWPAAASTYLYPIQTDVQTSPALSNTSQLSDSTTGLLSPSPTTGQGPSYPAILSSPESPVHKLGSLSPALGITVGDISWE